jgi:hypothetical protein
MAGNRPVLPRLGAGGHQPKTLEGHLSAIKHFNEFVRISGLKQIGVGKNELSKPFDQWTASDWSDELIWQQFAFHLAHEAVKNIQTNKNKGERILENEDGEPLAISSARQYLSNLMQIVCQQHTQSGIEFYKQFANKAKGESIPWVKRIRDDMRNEMERHLLMAGIPTMLKPRGIGWKLLDNIIDVLIDSGNA